jgi:hypothetical protein
MRAGRQHDVNNPYLYAQHVAKTLVQWTRTPVGLQAAGSRPTWTIFYFFIVRSLNTTLKGSGVPTKIDSEYPGYDNYCRIKRECIATAFTTTDPGNNNAGVRRFTTTEGINSGGLNDAGRGRVAALSMRGRQERQQRTKERKVGQGRQAREANETDRGCRQERQEKTGTV